MGPRTSTPSAQPATSTGSRSRPKPATSTASARPRLASTSTSISTTRAARRSSERSTARASRSSSRRRGTYYWSRASRLEHGNRLLLGHDRRPRTRRSRRRRGGSDTNRTGNRGNVREHRDVGRWRRLRVHAGTRSHLRFHRDGRRARPLCMALAADGSTVLRTMDRPSFPYDFATSGTYYCGPRGIERWDWHLPVILTDPASTITETPLGWLLSVTPDAATRLVAASRRGATPTSSHSRPKLGIYNFAADEARSILCRLLAPDGSTVLRTMDRVSLTYEFPRPRRNYVVRAASSSGMGNYSVSVTDPGRRPRRCARLCHRTDSGRSGNARRHRDLERRRLFRADNARRARLQLHRKRGEP